MILVFSFSWLKRKFEKIIKQKRKFFIKKIIANIRWINKNDNDIINVIFEFNLIDQMKFDKYILITGGAGFIG